MNHDSIIAKEGFPFIAIAAVTALIAFAAGFPGIGIALVLVTLFISWFFRNPERFPPEHLRLIVSPADGKVIRIEELGDPDLAAEKVRKISIFMNVFNVHVNRIPYTGQIVSMAYRQGKFLSADLDKASEVNERNTVLIRTATGETLKIVQIAGLIARRIVWWVQEGMTVNRGERFGLIRFGSRVEVFLPLHVKVLVQVGQKVRAGETPIGEMP